MSGRPVFAHLDIGRLIAAAGGDPWAIEEQLAAGDPAAIEGLAEAFHTAGSHVKAADDEFTRAREQFKTAYSRDHGTQHPINDAAEVQKVTAALAEHPEALATVAVSLEQIAAGLAEAQNAANAEIEELNTALHSIDAELSTAAVPLLILNLLTEADDQTRMSLGILEKIQGVYALQLHTEQTTMHASGYGAEAIDAADGVDQHGLPPGAEPGGPYAAGTLAGLQRAMDQAVLDEMAKVRQIQKDIDDAAALAYTKGPGSPEAQDALARLPGLKQKLIDELNTLGNVPDYSKLDPSALSSTPDGDFLVNYQVDGTAVQAMGKLANGTGEVFDQAKQTYYTFKDGRLVGVRALDPGRVSPDDELMFNAVTLAVGAPELAVGVKAGGEAAFQGLKSLLGAEGMSALRSSGESLLTRSMAAAQTRAEAAGYRFSDDWAPRPLPTADGLPPPVVSSGHPPPPAVAGEHPHTVSGDNAFAAANGTINDIPAPHDTPGAHQPLDYHYEPVLDDSGLYVPGSLPSYEDLRHLTASEPDAAHFWSGRDASGMGVGPDGSGIAERIAGGSNGTTLEMTLEKNGINPLPTWNRHDPESVRFWEDASAAYAENTRGQVTAVIGSDLRPGNIWQTVEIDRLIGNPAVTRIEQIDPDTGQLTVIFERNR